MIAAQSIVALGLSAVRGAELYCLCRHGAMPQSGYRPSFHYGVLTARSVKGRVVFYKNPCGGRIFVKSPPLNP